MDTPKLNGYGRLLLLIVVGILLLGFGLGIAIGLSSCASGRNVATDTVSDASSEDTTKYVRDQPYKAANYQNQVAKSLSPQLPKTAAGKVLAKVFGGSGKQKVKNSTIIYQVGEGNMAAVPSKTEAPVQLGEQNKATDNREAGADGGAAGIGKGNTPTVSTKEAGPPWYVYAGLVLASATGGWILRNRASKWAWVPARWKLA
ncbi:hypothetical protein [Hymenobacter fodinae]|uniref:Uncharacterized protein n=1 Tax=Hymenobacter fodinae TaxID=2510796 RepID=A0A4Z0P6Z8_9BACT|nr:hypothetical protein [Hymenobacter fodinae]TGE07695.1 hypothetical protein EU556_08045 [Hymenobacter fodinae]